MFLWLSIFRGNLVRAARLVTRWVGSVSSGRIGALEDFCEGVADAGGQSVRGKTRLPGDVAADDA